MIIFRLPALVILILALLPSGLGNYSKTTVDIYIGGGNLIADNFFKEPFESAVFIFYNYDYIEVTNNLVEEVKIPIDLLESEFKRNNHTISDCLFIVHNHLKPSTFSYKDIQFYNSIHARGFNGLFAIYYPFYREFRIYGKSAENLKNVNRD